MPRLNFEPLVGMTAPSAAELREIVARNWVEAFNEGDGAPELDTESATPAGQLVDAETAILAQSNAELLYLFSMLNPRLAEGVWQDAIGYIYFLTRKIAQPTLVTCTCTGLQGTVIPARAQIQSDTGIRYECVNAASIPAAGTVDVLFQCVEAGPVECPPESLTRIITVVPGWDTVSNRTAGATGRHRESQVDFENRRYESVAKNSHGALASLQGALWDLDGVLDCRVLENTGDDPITEHGVLIPGHSVAICVYGGEDADIAETIYLKKDAGCGTTGNVTVTHQTTEEVYGGATYSYRIMRPTPVEVGVRVTINRTNLTPTDAEAKIRNAIIADFLGENADSGNARVGLASTVYASRFAVAVVKTAGVQDLVGIDIRLGDGEWGASIVIDGASEPVISESDVTVLIEE